MKLFFLCIVTAVSVSIGGVQAQVCDLKYHVQVVSGESVN